MHHRWVHVFWLCSGEFFPIRKWGIIWRVNQMKCLAKINYMSLYTIRFSIMCAMFSILWTHFLLTSSFNCALPKHSSKQHQNLVVSRNVFHISKFLTVAKCCRNKRKNKQFLNESLVAHKPVIENSTKIKSKVSYPAICLPLAVYSKHSYDSCQNLWAMCMILTLKSPLGVCMRVYVCWCSLGLKLVNLLPTTCRSNVES